MAAKKDYLFDPDRNPLFRDDYRPSEYLIPSANIRITLDDTQSIVHNRIWVKRNPDTTQGGPLVLDGENLKLKSLQIVENGTLRHLDRSEYMVTDKNLILKNPPSSPFQLEIVTEINPEKNTTLSGLYKSGDILCTQCEAQGFRRISYFLDRPDNLCQFTVSLSADKAKYPILLANGNGDHTQSTDLGDGRHSITWTDPWPKPSYLFAVVAGDMKILEDSFTTMSGRKVDLRIFVEDGYEDKIQWAMQSIKRAMKWDEDRYGREYDLDCFHVVAVDKFNAGAMENKGLNVFNVSLLVGSPETSTDSELTAIEAVIGHEYFHNWTGDRVTVRDWFELTLKEGLTVLRDRQFTEDMHSLAIKRIDDATGLRAGQFMEDSSPMAHPIRPDRVEEFDNIYTGTIYQKGSHVLGMLHTMMGEKVWRAAMDEYFDRFDGQAVTCDDFLDVMEETSGIDLTQFRKWYQQAGTPEITYDGVYNAQNKTYTLYLTQNTPPTLGQPVKENLHIPVAVGLIGQSGKDIPLVMKGDDPSAAPQTTRVLHLTDSVETFVFENVDGPVVPSVLRGFSAPVKIKTKPSNEDLIFRMAHDSDSFNRFEAGERLMIKTLHRMINDDENDLPMTIGDDFLAAYGENVAGALDGDLAFNARMLQMPSFNLVIQDLKRVDPETVHLAMHFLRKTLAHEFADGFKNIYAATQAPDETYDVVPEQVGRRELHNLALSFMGKLDDASIANVAQTQFNQASCMTEKLGALATLTKIPSTVADPTIAAQALEKFYQDHKTDNNVVDKWLQIAAGIAHDNPVQNVRDLMNHEAYDKTNPNKVYALLGGFMSGNMVAFHNKDGSGYRLLGDTVIKMNDINPKVASNLSKRFAQFHRYDDARQTLMIAEMERIMQTAGLDAGVKEILGKALDQAAVRGGAPSSKFGKAAKP